MAKKKCVISPDLKISLLAYVVNYAKNNQTSKDDVIKQAIKNLWENNNSDTKNYYFIETLSMIPTLVKNNIFVSNISNDNSLNNYKDLFNISEVNDLMSKFEGDNWFKELGSIINFTSDLNTNRLKKSDGAISYRKEDIDLAQIAIDDDTFQSNSFNSYFDNVSDIYYINPNNNNLEFASPESINEEGKVINDKLQPINLENIFLCRSNKISNSSYLAASNVRFFRGAIDDYIDKPLYFKTERLNPSEETSLEQILSDKPEDQVPIEKQPSGYNGGKRNNPKQLWFGIGVYDETGNKIGYVQHDQDVRNANKIEADIIKFCVDESNPSGMLPFSINKTNGVLKCNFKTKFYFNVEDTNRANELRKKFDSKPIPKQVENKRKLDEQNRGVSAPFVDGIQAISTYLMNQFMLEGKHTSDKLKTKAPKEVINSFANKVRNLISSNQPIEIDGKRIYLTGAKFKSDPKLKLFDTVLIACDENGNPLKFSLVGNDLKIDNENGGHVVFNMPFAKSKYNEVLSEDQKKKMKSYGLKDEQIANFNNYISNLFNIVNRIRNGQKIMFDIVGMSLVSTSIRDVEWNAENCSDLEPNSKIEPTGEGLQVKIGNSLYELDNCVLDQSQQEGLFNLLFDPNYKINKEGTKYRITPEERFNIANSLLAGGFKIGNNEYSLFSNKSKKQYGIKVKNGNNTKFYIFGSNKNDFDTDEIKNALSSANARGFSKLHLHIEKDLIKANEFPYLYSDSVEIKKGQDKTGFNSFLSFYKFKYKKGKHTTGDEAVPTIKELQVSNGSSEELNNPINTEPNITDVNDESIQLETTTETPTEEATEENTETPIEETTEEVKEENTVEQQQEQPEEQDEEQDDDDIDLNFLDDHTSNDDEDRDFNAGAEDDGESYKTIEAKAANDPVTAEQIKTAKEWFEKSPVSKVLGFTEAFDTVHKIGVAKWTKHGITLMNGSDYTDLYHESWHQFSQLYLTKQQKRELYDQVKGKKGTFIDEHNNVTKFSEATDRQIEEYLAEGFRTYMLKGSTKETGKIKAFFQKIWNIIKSFFSKDAIMTPESLYKKLRNNDIAEFTADRQNSMFTVLYRSIELVGKENEDGEQEFAGNMSSKETMDIENLMNIYIADYPSFVANVKKDPKLSKNFHHSVVRGFYYDLSKGISKDDAILKFIPKDLSEEEKQKAKRSFIYMINKFEKTVEKDSGEQTNINSISELMSRKDNIKEAYDYALTRLYKLLSDKQVELQAENNKKKKDAIKVCKLEQQIGTINKAIDNFGNTNDINSKVVTQGVVAYHYKEFFGDIQYEEISGEEIEDETEDSANFSTEEGHSDSKCNSQSAEQRMKNDQLMRFILSTLPSYTLSRRKGKEEFVFTADYNEYGEREIKQFKLVKNRLTTILQGCTGPMDIYNKLCSLAYEYKNDKQIVYDPVLDAIIKRMGMPGSYSVEDHYQKLEKDLLWNRFWQVFACPEVPPIEVNITYNSTQKVDYESGETYTKETISTTANEMTGPYWKLDDYYRARFLNTGSEYITVTQNGRGINLEKVMLEFFVSKDKETGNKATSIQYVRDEDGIATDMVFLDKDGNIIDEEELDKNDPYYAEHIFDLITALGLNITPNKMLNEELSSIENLQDVYIDIFNKVKELLILKANGENTNECTDPVSHFWKNYNDTFSTSDEINAIYNKAEIERVNLKNIYDAIKKIDIHYVENINTEMVRNAEGSVMFMNQLNNSISQLLNHLNKCKNYYDVLQDPALRHLDVRPYIIENGKIIKNPRCNYNVLGSRILKLMFPGIEKFSEDSIPNDDDLKNIKKSEKFSMSLINLSGVKVINRESGLTKGESLFSSDKSTKILSDLVLMSNGLQEFMRHADKGVSYGLKFKIGDNGDNTIIDNKSSFEQAIYPYIESEIQRVIHIEELKKKASEGNLLYDHNYLNNSESTRLGVFEDMLSKETTDAIRDEIKRCVEENDKFNFDKILTWNSYFEHDPNNDNELKEYEVKESDGITIQDKILNDLTHRYFPSIIEENKNIIFKALEAFDTNSERIEDVQNAENKKLLFIKSIINNKRSAFINLANGSNSLENQNEVIENMTLEEMVEEVAKYFTIQNSVYNIECLKVIYGDSMIYNHKKDDFTKRIGGMGSSGSIFNTEDWMENRLKEYSKSSYVKYIMQGDENFTDPFIRTGEHQGELKTAICSDIFPLSAYRKKYNEISKNYNVVEEESNAQGLISFDSYRYMCIREGKWDKQKEMLFQKIARGEGKSIDPKDVVKYFPILKLQYEGPLNTGDMPLQAFHKYALMPIIPTMVENKNLDKVHKAMMREGIDYITFNSAAKLSVVSNGKKSRSAETDKNFKSQYGDILYDESTIDREARGNTGRKLNSALENSTEEKPFFTPNYIPLAYMKDQVLIHDELDEETIFSTQMRRLIGNNLFSEGYPVRLNDEKWTHDDWDKFDYNEKLNASAAFRAVENYKKALGELTKKAITGIKKEFGIKGNGQINEQAFLTYIKKELIKKGIPEFAMKDMTLDDLQFSFYSKEVEAVIVGLISKRIIQQHVHGGQFVQVAPTLWENPDDTESEGTNDLQFYQDPNDIQYDKSHVRVVKPGEDKIEPATIKIPLAGDFVNLLQANMFDNEGNELDTKVSTLENLNKMLKNQAWVDKYKQAINIVACRIPVQGHNSMEFYRIAEFLAPGSNNIIVCPSELVIKSGGDYDVDKLSTIIPNIKVVEGELFIPSSNSKEAFTDEQTKELIETRTAYNKFNNNLINSITKNLKNIVKYKSNNTVTGKDKKGHDIVKFNSHTEESKKAEDFLKALKPIKSKIKELIKIANNKSNLVDNAERYEASKQLKQEFKKLDDLLKSIANEYHFTEVDPEPQQAKRGEGISWYDSWVVYKDRLDTKSKLDELFSPQKQKQMLNSSKWGYENDLLQSMIDILMMPVNYKSLLTPNSTDDFTGENQPANKLRANADYDRFHSKVNEHNDNMHPTRIIEWRYNLEKHDDLNTGKVILGPAAIDNVFAPVAKQVGVFLSDVSHKTFKVSSLENNNELTTEKEVLSNVKSNTDKKSRTTLVNSLLNKKEQILSQIEDRNVSYQNLVSEEIDKEIEEVAQYRQQRLLLPCNTSKRTQRDGSVKKVISLSHTYDSMNEKEISDIISQYMNGCVDVAKDAWIRYIQGNREAIPTFMFMLQAGVPKDYVCYFLSNPAVVEYIEQKIKIKSSINGLNKSEAINKQDEIRANMLGVETHIKGKIKNKFIIKSEINSQIDYELNIYDKNPIGKDYFSLEKLIAVATKSEQEKNRLKLNDGNEDVFNARVLAHFFEIEDMASAMNSLKLDIRVDAANARTIYDIVSKQSGHSKINENQRLEPGIVDKVKEESVLSSFFIEDTVYDIFNAVCPTKVDKDVKYVFDNVIVKQLANMPGDASDNYDRFFNELKNFLYQMSKKTSTDDSYVKQEIVDVIKSIEELDSSSIISQPLIMNKICEVYTKTKQRLDRSTVESSIAYKKYLEYTNVDFNNIELEEGQTLDSVKDLVYDKFIMLETLHSIGIGDVLFKFNQYDFSTRYSMVLDLIAKSNNTDLQSVMLFKKMDISVKENNTNIFFKEDVDELSKQAMREEVIDLQDGKLDAILKDSELGEYDKEFIRNVFNQFGQYSLLQSGLSSSAKSLNFVFDLSKELKSAYDERMSDQSKKEDIILDFQQKFLKKYANSDYASMFSDCSWDDFNTGEEYSIGDHSGIIYTQSYSEYYTQRTKDNANNTDITIAIAKDFNTSGENLTKNVAGDKYIAIDFNGTDNKKDDAEAKKVYNFLVEKYGIDNGSGKKVLDKNTPIRINFAGNDIYTFVKYEITQEQVDKKVTKILKDLINLGVNVTEVRSGGQTGVDEAGLKAAVENNIKTIICHSPKGYRMRSEDDVEIFDEKLFKERFGDSEGRVISKNSNKKTSNTTSDNVSEEFKQRVDNINIPAIIEQPTTDEVEVVFNGGTYMVTRDGVIYTKSDPKKKPKYESENGGRKNILAQAKQLFNKIDNISVENTNTQVNQQNITNVQVNSVVNENRQIIDGFTREESNDIYTLENMFKIKFNKEQREAIINISNYLIDDTSYSSSDFALIDGKAGTGKTTVMKAVIERWKIHKENGWDNPPLIIAGAVAHQAKDVLRNSMKDSSHRKILFKTVAAMTGKAQGYDEDSDGKLVRNFNGIQKSKLSDAHIIIVDECSMVNEKNLNELITNRGENSKLIFMGDIGQLPPIRTSEDGYNSTEIELLKSKVSPVFTESKIKSHLIKRERQGEESPILTVADSYWTDENGKNISIKKKNYPNEVNNEGVLLNIGAAMVDNGDGTITVSDNVLKLYERARDTQNPRFVQYICYTNSENRNNPILREFNDTIHKKLFPESKNNIAEGETIYFNDQYWGEDLLGSNKPTLINNAYVDIVLSMSEEMIFDDPDMSEHNIKIKYKEATLKNANCKIKILINTDENKENFKKLISYRHEKRKQLGKENGFFKNGSGFNAIKEKAFFSTNPSLQRYDKMNIWKLENTIFANIDYGYAINTHKCQGSTYDVVIVDKENINILAKVDSPSSRDKAMYTALTRSRHAVIIVDSDTEDSVDDESESYDWLSLVDKLSKKRNEEQQKRLNLIQNSNSNQQTYGDSLMVNSDKIDNDDYKCPLK